MVIISDIIINHGYTEENIIIDDLAHYWDLYADSIAPLAMVLKTNDIPVIPYVILLDHSFEKKDAALLHIKSHVSKINSSVVIPVERQTLSLISSAKKCVLHSSSDTSENNIKLSFGADVAMSFYVNPDSQDMHMQSDIMHGVHNHVYLFQEGCKLSTLDDMYLHELDPYLLSEIDNHVGARLSSSLVDLKTERVYQ